MPTMVPDLDVVPNGGARAAPVLHLALLGVVLAACLLAPTEGRAVVLVPLLPGPATDARLLADNGLAVIGRTEIGNMPLLRATGAMRVAGLLRQGLLPVGVPWAGCGRTYAGTLAER